MGDQKIIYPVGDSHAWHCWLKIPEASTYTVGPMTLYHFGLYKPVVTDLIPKDKIVVFCWGEIDCRCHVYMHLPSIPCINNLVKNYREAIKVNTIGRDPGKVWVYNVVPPAKEHPLDNPGFPFLGTGEERLSYAQYMNETLSRMCHVEGWTFVDVYKFYSDKEGFLIPGMSDDQVHVSDPKPLQEFVNAHT